MPRAFDGSAALTAVQALGASLFKERNSPGSVQGRCPSAQRWLSVDKGA
jgi:hypothetical protein